MRLLSKAFINQNWLQLTASSVANPNLHHTSKHFTALLRPFLSMLDKTTWIQFKSTDSKPPTGAPTHVAWTFVPPRLRNIEQSTLTSLKGTSTSCWRNSFVNTESARSTKQPSGLPTAINKGEAFDDGKEEEKVALELHIFLVYENTHFLQHTMLEAVRRWSGESGDRSERMTIGACSVSMALKKPPPMGIRWASDGHPDAKWHQCVGGRQIGS
ncbi:hypothetical protein TcWFU_007347 [Taenia crassiceps]|uniref:Uncharacterized protein n=1 Tax=Taenia crassiceps TaxID=6207 RepID=A0ABR4Q0K3_9CEST